MCFETEYREQRSFVEKSNISVRKTTLQNSINKKGDDLTVELFVMNTRDAAFRADAGVHSLLNCACTGSVLTKQTIR